MMIYVSSGWVYWGVVSTCVCVVRVSFVCRSCVLLSFSSKKAASNIRSDPMCVCVFVCVCMYVCVSRYTHTAIFGIGWKGKALRQCVGRGLFDAFFQPASYILRVMLLCSWAGSFLCASCKCMCGVCVGACLPAGRFPCSCRTT